MILLLVFGAKRLPEIGRSLGSGMREFKDSVSGDDADATQATSSSRRPPGSLATQAPAVAQPVRRPP